ncbi:15688_t:CDS:2, partial [Dentiscutata erythropus]
QQTTTKISVHTKLALSNMSDNSLIDVLKDITTNTINNSDNFFENYESILQDALLIVQEQHATNNVK